MKLSLFAAAAMMAATTVSAQSYPSPYYSSYVTRPSSNAYSSLFDDLSSTHSGRGAPYRGSSSGSTGYYTTAGTSGSGVKGRKTRSKNKSKQTSRLRKYALPGAIAVGAGGTAWYNRDRIHDFFYGKKVQADSSVTANANGTVVDTVLTASNGTHADTTVIQEKIPTEGEATVTVSTPTEVPAVAAN